MSRRFWADRPVLVTGGTGFIGSWIVDDLAERGANVIVLVRDLTTFSRRRLQDRRKAITTVFGDLTQVAQIERIVNEYEIDTLLHLGAQAVVGTANRSPLSTFESNIRGTWNILEVARGARTLSRTVLASSDKAYGEPTKLPITESHPLQASHPYDVSKACCDLLGQTYFKTYGLPIAITRCSNVYGGGDTNYSRLVPSVMRSVLRGERPVIRSDGTPVRDYLYVSDAVEAYSSLAENLNRAEIKGQAFNFGHNNPISVLDLTARIIRLSGCSDLKPMVKGESSGEIQRQYLSSEKAKRLLGWAPIVKLDEGLKRTLTWYRQELDRTLCRQI